MTKKEKNKLLLNQTVDWAKIDKKKLKLLLNNALEEEVGRQSISKPIDGDITTVSCGLNGIAKAKLHNRQLKRHRLQKPVQSSLQHPELQASHQREPSTREQTLNDLFAKPKFK